jgi:hypothetical protein
LTGYDIKQINKRPFSWLCFLLKAILAPDKLYLGMKVMKIIKESISIGLGILAAGFGLKGFLLSSHFIDGGVTCVSMLVADI